MGNRSVSIVFNNGSNSNWVEHKVRNGEMTDGEKVHSEECESLEDQEKFVHERAAYSCFHFKIKTLKAVERMDCFEKI